MHHLGITSLDPKGQASQMLSSYIYPRNAVNSKAPLANEELKFSTMTFSEVTAEE